MEKNDEKKRKKQFVRTLNISEKFGKMNDETKNKKNLKKIRID